MSGGIYDYAYYRVAEFAERMMLDPRQRKCPDCERYVSPDETGHREDCGTRVFDDGSEVEPLDPVQALGVQYRKRFQEHLLKVSELMKELEWTDSGDTGEDDMVRAAAAFFGDPPPAVTY